MGVERIHLSLDFEEIVDAFEESDALHHYFIDTQTNDIIYVNEAVGENCKTQLEKLEDERFLMIPPRRPKDAFLVMETFVYETIPDHAVAEKFIEVLGGNRPFSNFKDLLINSPELRKQWFTYERKHLKNEVINWLYENHILLTDQSFIPKIEIQELTAEDIDRLPNEIKDFKPCVCLRCQNRGEMIARIFSINVPIENLLIEEETKRILKERFGVMHHGVWSGENQDFLTAAHCPRCGCEEILWDY
jgi:hypothetical protein